MVSSVVLALLVVALLTKITMGPQRWHRVVTEHTRPGSWPPDRRGEALVITRDVLALVALGAVLAVALVGWVGDWRTDQRLYDATYAAAEILPPENLQSTQVETLVEELTGHEVLLVDASDDDSEVSLDDVYWAPDDESVPVEDLDLPAPAACLAIDRTGGLPAVDVTEGSCDQREE